MIPMLLPAMMVRTADYTREWADALEVVNTCTEDDGITKCGRQHYVKKVNSIWVAVCVFSEEDFK